MLLLALVFLASFGLVAGGVAFVERDRLAAARAARARLLRHVPRTADADAPGLVRGAVRVSGFRVLERFLLDTPLGRVVTARAGAAVRAAGVQRTAGEVVLGTTVSAALGVLLGVLLDSTPAALVLGALGALLPGLVLGRIATRRSATFDAQLPEALETIANSLRAGYSLPAAVEFAASETPTPLGGELARLRDEQRLGMEVRDALGGFADRVGTDDARMFVTAVLIQRETGGNLADLLANLAALVRERQAFKLRVAALTAEPRMSALVLALLPLGVLVMMLLLNAAYVQPLFEQPTGRMLLGGAMLLSGGGYLVMRRVGTVEL